MMKNKEFKLSFTPEEAFNEVLFKLKVAKIIGDVPFVIKKRSIDARKKKIKVLVHIEPVSGIAEKSNTWKPEFPKSNGKIAVIVGFGPAGMFAAIRCLEKGIKPIILERGKNVRDRRRDLARLNRDMIVDEDSNYCFGEGGAGTYSDGKLYTRSTKRGDVKRILEILQFHGAPEEILYDAHPHIGTNKLPNVVQNIRNTILEGGGEIHFNQRVVQIKTSGKKVCSVKTQEGDGIKGDYFLLATGHSARDIYSMLHHSGILIEEKPFAIGVRIEHPQELIDQIQYHCTGKRSEWLPAASYSLKHQSSLQRGVFSFCMCPGGFIVASATAPGEVVVNGMSPSKRNSKYANAGTVVTVSPADFQKYTDKGPLAGMYFQAEIERKACQTAGNTQVAPAQRMTDFMGGKLSGKLNDTSYVPGIKEVDLKEVLPYEIHQSLKEGIKSFGKKMKGYYTNEAQLIGVESRTSSPVRIPRDKELLCHPQFENLYPSGEGAGFAGGIVSAAIDGNRCAERFL